MPFEPKDWIDEPELHDVLDGTASPTSTTPLDGAALEDLETRVTDYAGELAAFVNVKDFGAMGDSEGTVGTGTDDTAAIQAAADYLMENMETFRLAQGGVLYFPRGLYSCEGELCFENSYGITLLGDGTTTSQASTTGLASTIEYWGTAPINPFLGQSANLNATASSVGGSLASDTYYYKIAAVDADGVGTPIAAGEDSAAVTGPSGSVGLTWDAVPGATDYRVFVGTKQGREDRYFTTATNSYTHTTMSGATTGFPQYGCFINARSTNGFTMRNMGVVYKNASFNPYSVLIDLSRGSTAADTHYPLFENCAMSALIVGASTAGPARALINLHRAILGRFIGGHYQKANYGIIFRDGSSYSNAFQVEGVTFDNFVPRFPPTGLAATPSASGGSLAAATYQYKVTAIGPWDGFQSAEVEGGACAQVTATTTGSSGSVALNWTDVADATDYRVYVGTEGNEQDRYFTVGSATSAFTHTTQSGATGGRPPFDDEGYAMTNPGEGIVVNNCYFEGTPWLLNNTGGTRGPLTFSNIWSGDFGTKVSELVRIVDGAHHGITIENSLIGGPPKGAVLNVQDGATVTNVTLRGNYIHSLTGGFGCAVDLTNAGSVDGIVMMGNEAVGQTRVLGLETDDHKNIYVGQNNDAYEYQEWRGHLGTRQIGAAPSVAAGAQSNSGAVAITANTNSNDIAGSVTFTPGAAATTGEQIVVTFAQAYKNVGDFLNVRPKVIITPMGQNAASASYWVTHPTARTSFAIHLVSPSNVQYIFDYHVLH